MADVFIEDLETVERENPYAPLVKQLSEAGEGKQARLQFESEKEAHLALSKIQAAAIDSDLSARKVGDIEEGSRDPETGKFVPTPGVWNLKVKLGPRRIRRTAEEVAAEKAEKEAAAQAKAEATAGASAPAAEAAKAA